MDKKMTPLETAERRIRVLDSNRNVFVGKAESQHRWLKSAMKEFHDYRSAENARSIARHAGELSVAVAKVDTFNEAMASLNEVYRSLGGKKLPEGVVLTAKPKYKRT